MLHQAIGIGPTYVMFIMNIITQKAWAFLKNDKGH